MKLELVYEVIVDATRHTLNRHVNWPCVPNNGDWIEQAPGWSSKPVHSRDFLNDGKVVIRLTSSNLESQEELERLKADGRWSE